MKKNQKRILKTFFIIYILSFTIINWNEISWIFNYRVISSLLYDFFTPYKTAEISSPSASILSYSEASNNSENNSSNNKEVKNYAYSEKENILEIPSIGISVPVVFPKSQDISVIVKDLDKGVVYYPGSVAPGQKGQIVMLGHSAPPGWPKIKHDWVFSDLNDLSEGDKINFHFDNKEYVYLVKNKEILKKGEEIIPDQLTNSNNMIVLVSCWPPGKNYQRIAVKAELQ